MNMTNKILICILISVSIHSIGFMLLNQPEPKPGRKYPEKVSIKITEKKPAKKPEKKKETKLLDKALSKKKGNKKCDDWYGGVGLTHTGNHVTRVAKGYGADRAGIRYGDMVLFIDDLRGPVGTVVLVKWMRGTKLYSANITREKICWER